jgi:1-aminocyclopropane-1-carboxylate synthase
MLRPVSSPADVIFSALLNDKSALNDFIKTNQSRLSEAQAYTRSWFQNRGIAVADSNAYVDCVCLPTSWPTFCCRKPTQADQVGADDSGHFVWVNLGVRLGFRDAAEEKRVFQLLLDGGVYIVCACPT